MLNKTQAQTNLENFYPDAEIKSWVEYRDLFLFRVEHPSENEKDWDPFFSVDKLTGEVRDFSVISDGDLSELSALKWVDI